MGTVGGDFGEPTLQYGRNVLPPIVPLSPTSSPDPPVHAVAHSTHRVSTVQNRPTHAHPVDTVHTCYRVLRAPCPSPTVEQPPTRWGALRVPIARPCLHAYGYRYVYVIIIINYCNRRGRQKNTDGRRATSLYRISVTYVRTRPTIRCARPPPPSAVCRPFRTELSHSDSEYRRWDRIVPSA